MRKTIYVLSLLFMFFSCKEEKGFENIDFSTPEIKKDTVVVRLVDTIKIVEKDTIIAEVVEEKKVYKRDTLDIENIDRGIGVMSIDTAINTVYKDIQVKMNSSDPDSTLLCRYVCAFPLMDIENLVVSSNYGDRELNGVKQFHHGIDIVTSDSIVYAAGSGVVSKIGYDRRSGLYLKIQHELVSTLYAHLNDLFVVEGDTITVLDSIGIVGNSGRSTAPHLHFEIRKNNNSIDVFEYYRTFLNLNINEQ